MSDSAALSSPSSIRRVSYQAVPAVPVSERRIKTLEQLPPHLRHKAETLPPYLKTKDAERESGRGRSNLYKAAAEGRVNCVKDGATTLWETLSILLDLANLPPAPVTPKVPRPAPSRGRPRNAAAAPRQLAEQHHQSAATESVAAE